MKLFHGGIKAIEFPIMLDSQRLLDFGKGFYTTTNKEQAEHWAIIKQKRIGKSAKSIVSVYEISDSILIDENYKVKIFDMPNEQWLDFIITNRSNNKSHYYDIVKGAVANDTLYATLLLFETGILTKKETIIRLKAHKLFDQISFHNQKVLKELPFIESYLVFSKPT